jgi:hypothetical protein
MPTNEGCTPEVGAEVDVDVEPVAVGSVPEPPDEQADMTTVVATSATTTAVSFRRFRTIAACFQS